MHCTVSSFTCGLVAAMTKNISRGGLLIHVATNGALPGVGEPVTVEVSLPAAHALARRCLRCRGTVVRVVGGEGPSLGVAIEVDHMVFRDMGPGVDETVWQGWTGRPN